MANEILYTVGIIFSAFITIFVITNESWEKDRQKV